MIRTPRWSRASTPGQGDRGPTEWVVSRIDDNGYRFEMSRHSSRCEADTVVSTFEACGHKQTYFVEPADGSASIGGGPACR